MRMDGLWWGVAWAALGVAAVGCQRTMVPDRPLQPMVTVNGSAASPDARTPISAEQALKSDPCSVRMHEISGKLLMYYVTHARLPKSLDELQSDVPAELGIEQAVKYTCPSTGEPYVYVPGGLRSPDDTRQIILHDRVPDRGGTRWAILMQPPGGRQAMATWVVPMSEPMFKAYAAPAGE